MGRHPQVQEQAAPLHRGVKRLRGACSVHRLHGDNLPHPGRERSLFLYRTTVGGLAETSISRRRYVAPLRTAVADNGHESKRTHAASQQNRCVVRVSGVTIRTVEGAATRPVSSTPVLLSIVGACGQDLVDPSPCCCGHWPSAVSDAVRSL